MRVYATAPDGEVITNVATVRILEDDERGLYYNPFPLSVIQDYHGPLVGHLNGPGLHMVMGIGTHKVCAGETLTVIPPTVCFTITPNPNDSRDLMNR